jgi:hypothetical protein
VCFFIAKNRRFNMFGKILGIILLVFIGLFSICSCKVASWADQEMEEELERRKKIDEEVSCGDRIQK